MTIAIKCPECNGQKCQHVSGNKYRCMYCGATFETEESRSETSKPQAADNNQTIVIDGNEVHTGSSQKVIIVQKKEDKEEETVYTHDRQKGTALALTFLLGPLGIQHFYLGNTWAGILSILFCWTYIPCFIAVFNFFNILFMSEETFNDTYNL